MERIKSQINSLCFGIFLVLLIFFQTKLILGPVVFYPQELVIYLVLIIVLISSKYRKQLFLHLRDLPYEVKISIGLILLGSVIGVVLAPSYHASIGALKAWVIDPIILAGLIIAFIKPIKLDTFRNLIIGYGLALSVIAIVIFFLNHQERLTGIFISPNYFSATVAPIFVLTIFSLSKSNWTKFWFFSIASIVMAIALILSQSLGAWLGIIVAGAFGVHYLAVSKNLKIALALLLLALVIIGMIVLSGRLAVTDNSLQARAQIWQVTGYLIQLHPIFGVGLQGFEFEYQKYLSGLIPHPIQWGVPEPHNLFLAIWVNIGLFGLLGFIWLIYLLFQGQKSLSVYHLAILAILGHGLVDTPYWTTNLVAMFWIYIAAIYLSKDFNAKFI